jgi:hypothetical protein
MRHTDYGIYCNGDDDGVMCSQSVWLSQVTLKNSTPAGLRAHLRKAGWTIGIGRRGRYDTAVDWCPAHAGRAG